MNIKFLGTRRKSMTQKKTSKKNTGLRPDIQGLRALAVLAVIADHLFHWPAGGFVGVDVFFVISGFLITGLLLREHERYGHISFANFYRRRVRRILPLAILVLLVTVIVSFLVLNIGRTKVIAEDAFWSLLFGANWHFALTGIDYMNAGAALSPVQHFWSLAVEEQFYLVWPWLVVLILGFLVNRFGWNELTGRLVLGLVMAAVTVLSFSYAIWETNTAPTVAYFSTFSRAWELGIGSLIALTANTWKRLPRSIRPTLSYMGLAGIAFSIFWMSPETQFPGPWAIIPVLSAGLVIAAGCGSQTLLAPITNRVTNYLGDISYSLYLWHFPVIVIGSALAPAGYWSNGLTLLLILIISSVSYHLLEDPIRRSSWLEPRHLKVNRPPLGLSPLPYLGVLMVVTLIAVSGAVWKDNNLSQPAPAVAGPRSDLPSVATAPTATGAQASNVSIAANSLVWPNLTPKPEDLGPETKSSEWVIDGCLAQERNSLPDPILNAEKCTYGTSNAPKTAVVLGDSIAISYVPGIRAALEPRGFKVLVYTMQQCPASALTVLANGGAHADCNPFREWALNQVRDLQPDMVIMASSLNTTKRLASGAEGNAAISEFKNGTVDSLTQISGHTKRIVILSSPPGGKNLQECITVVSKPSDCATSTGVEYRNIFDATRDAADAVGGETRVDVVDTRPWFCTSGNVCPSYIGVTPVYADAAHLTETVAKQLSPVIVEALQLEPLG